MTVSELLQALAQFAPGAEVLFIENGYATTPHTFHREGNHVRFHLEPYHVDERETNP